MFLNCGCGTKVYVPLMFTDQQTVACYDCGQKYNRKGYLIGDPPKVDVLAVLRHVRDNAPAEWDALVATTAGTLLLNLWDALKREEKS